LSRGDIGDDVVVRHSNCSARFRWISRKNFVANENGKWFGTVRARLGWLPVDNILLYGTGGLAYGHAGAVVNSVFDVSVAGAKFSFICLSGPNCAVG
jgi:outer membrane immunogenic protein